MNFNLPSFVLGVLLGVGIIMTIDVFRLKRLIRRMGGRPLALLLVFSALALGGCATARNTGRSMTAAFGNMVTVHTDLPVRSTAVSVLNKTPDQVVIFVDRVGMGGEPIATIPPYGHAVVPFGNWSGNSVEVRLIAHLVRAGQVAGVASESFSVSGYYADSPSWELDPDDFR